MRLRNVLIAIFCLALAVPGVASAQRSDADKVTGGGQIIVDSSARGPGDTVGFVATTDGARTSGEFQIVRTSLQSGSRETIYHGVVECVVVHSDNTATFAGYARYAADGQLAFFRVDVEDNGPDNSGGTQGNDLIVVRQDDEEFDCDDFDDDEQLKLARGNLTVHNAGN